MALLLDTNFLIALIRRKPELPPFAVILIITVGELKAFAVKRNWGYQKRATLEKIFSEIPVLGIEPSLTDVYATVDAYSQGCLASDP
ncbi:hypothetical protein WBJ53_01880 [Spirosoma sp. SC4-14]|uniref:hypothetical protein n=1 Tax=Spirosoma sp. SC4-14 TaxID=3128900 RepID=UPI0030D562D1